MFLDNLIKKLTLAIFIALIIAVFYVWLSPDTKELNSYGDFPAFYSAAKLVAEGRFDDLYNQLAHKDIQLSLPIKQDNQSFLLFSYPPFYALLLSPLGLISFKYAYFAHVFLMSLCLIVALRNLQVIFPEVKASIFWLFIFSFISYPVFRSIIGGQNTMLSLLLFSLASRMFIQDKYFKSGIILGFWLFKMQFAWQVLLLFLFKGRLKLFTGSLIVVIFYYLLGAIISGAIWPYEWMANTAWPFAELDLKSNFIKSVTIKAQLYRYFGSSFYVKIVSWLMVASVFIYLALKFMSMRETNFPKYIACAAAIILLVSPHALFYEASLLIVSCFYLAPSKRNLLLAGLGLLSWLEPLALLTHIQTSFITVLFTLGSVIFTNLSSNSR